MLVLILHLLLVVLMYEPRRDASNFLRDAPVFLIGTLCLFVGMCAKTDWIVRCAEVGLSLACGYKGLERSLYQSEHWVKSRWVRVFVVVFGIVAVAKVVSDGVKQRRYEAGAVVCNGVAQRPRENAEVRDMLKAIDLHYGWPLHISKVEAMSRPGVVEPDGKVWLSVDMQREGGRFDLRYTVCDVEADNRLTVLSRGRAKGSIDFKTDKVTADSKESSGVATELEIVSKERTVAGVKSDCLRVRVSMGGYEKSYEFGYDENGWVE